MTHVFDKYSLFGNTRRYVRSKDKVPKLTNVQNFLFTIRYPQSTRGLANVMLHAMNVTLRYVIKYLIFTQTNSLILSYNRKTIKFKFCTQLLHNPMKFK